MYKQKVLEEKSSESVMWLMHMHKRGVSKYSRYYEGVRELASCNEKVLLKRCHPARLIKLIQRESSLEDRFKVLSERWKIETGAYSTTIHKIANQNYREIVNLGIAVIPFILKDLESSPVWFPALREITKENPVARQDAGNTEKMREAWIIWGRERGII